ncbi:Uncharacterised protein [Salmonella enterica subsp. enterica serovar Bovismorbificans]|uniref:Uncharacterized protein n=1 Tax=Salmonella enterica subsp. enterica serovar Bovismorbificans TaxID=58097 RepID=A0A655CXQ7_SALET|nr:Uncharacterised protein [Salmonella enterica subsp. enterica serovar Bovismorbificans]CNU34505.1 Uncharacterised protein [Salmonella enterica subsp. enterica serovar Bovismorbificans]
MPAMGITCIGANSIEPVSTSTVSVSPAPTVMAINEERNALSIYLLRFCAFQAALKQMNSTISSVRAA